MKIIGEKKPLSKETLVIIRKGQLPKKCLSCKGEGFFYNIKGWLFKICNDCKGTGNVYNNTKTT